jgi:hypothetical protein
MFPKGIYHRERKGAGKTMTVRLVAGFFLWLAFTASAADENTEAILKRLELLEKKQAEYEVLLKEKDDRIKELEFNSDIQLPAHLKRTNNAPVRVYTTSPIATYDEEGSVASGDAAPKPKLLGQLQPNYGGFKIGESKWGDLNFRLYTYARYLNQQGLDETYTDAFGRTRQLDRRNDVQLNKVQLQTMGWIYDQKLRYFLYVWSSNPTMGQGAQVVVAGNLNYAFNDYFKLGVGITSLPTTRTTEGNFPRWLKVDSRTMADEFFRGSYTTGIWLSGNIKEGLDYRVMAGNNLSTLGVDAIQLDDKFQTYSGALMWMPTTGEYGPVGSYGDLEQHESLATRAGLHFTFSTEDRQSQPGQEDPENTQIRLSDGTGLFDVNAFGPNTQVQRANYEMASFDAGLKYRGFSLEGEYFFRWINRLRTVGAVPFDSLFDHGPQLQMSYMVTPTWQLYATGSKIFGQYGDPFDASLGFNWYPVTRKGFERQFRINGEVFLVRNSPTGYSSFPYIVGANGPIWMLNMELFF